MIFKNVRSAIAVFLAAALVLVFSQFVGAAENNCLLQGVVKDSSEKPVTGAFVRLKNNERHLTFLVISQAEGRYSAGNLPATAFVAEGIAGGRRQEARRCPLHCVS